MKHCGVYWNGFLDGETMKFDDFCWCRQNLILGLALDSATDHVDKYPSIEMNQLVKDLERANNVHVDTMIDRTPPYFCDRQYGGHQLYCWCRTNSKCASCRGETKE